MGKQKHFNLKRFTSYLKYNVTLHGKTYLYFSIGLFLAVIFINLFTLCTASSKIGFINGYYIPIFFFTYIISGVLAVGTSFPLLRNSISTSSFLLLPVSVFEKFLEQFIVRVVGFNILFFPLFWGAFKVAYFIYNLFQWDDPIQIERLDLFSRISNGFSSLEHFAFLFGILSIASFLLAGAAYYKKYAVFKTALIFALLWVAFFVIMILFSHLFLPDMVEGLNIRILDRRISEVMGATDLYLYILCIGSSLFLLPLAYFKLKEKEL